MIYNYNEGHLMSGPLCRFLANNLQGFICWTRSNKQVTFIPEFKIGLTFWRISS